MKKNLYLVKKLGKEELEVFISEYKKNKNLLTSGRFFGGYTHSESYACSLREVVRTRDERNSEKSRSTGFGDIIQVRNSDVSELFPETLSSLKTLASLFSGHLARVVIVRTINEYRYFPHIDKGYYYIFHKRYHIVLHSTGSVMMSGEETGQFTTGDIFFLDNRSVHGGKHAREDEERVHIIFDILPNNPFVIIGRFVHWLFIERAVPEVNNMSFGKGLAGVVYLMHVIILTLLTYRYEK